MYVRVIATVVALGAALGPGTSFAGISLNNQVIDYRPGDGSIKDVVIKNHGKTKEYIRVDLFKVVNPGEKEEQIPVDKRDTSLVISPRKLIIPPGESKTLRIISRQKDVASDVVYRANVTPVIREELQGAKFGVKVVMAYGLLVIIRPPELVRSVKGERNGLVLKLANDGNTNVEFREGKQCVGSGDAQRCETVSGERIYPGRAATLSLPLDAPIRFTYRMAGEFFTEVY